MGLRSDLQDLLDLQSLSGEFQKATGGLREQAAQQVLNQQAPDLIQQGNFGALAGLAGQAGQQPLQTGIVEKLIAERAAQAKAKAAPGKLTREQIIATLPPDLAANEGYVTALENAPDLKTQLQLKGQAQSFLSGEKNRAATTQRFGETQTQGQRKEASNIIGSAVDETRKEQDQLAKINNLLSLKDNKSAVNSAITFIARATGNTGVLTDKDIERVLGTTFQGSAQDIKNYLEGKNDSNLTEPQRQSLLQLVAELNKASGSSQQRAIQNAVTRAIEQNPRLVGKDGKLDPSLQGPLGRYGGAFQGFDPVKGAQINFKGANTSVKQPTSVEAQGVDISGLASKINQIKDPTRKAQATAELQKFNGKSINKASYDKFNSVLDAVLGAQ